MTIIARGGTLDPLAGLVPSPDTDYAELAAAHLALAQSAALNMQRLAAELVTLQERAARGNWFLLTEPDAPNLGEAERLLWAIKDDIHTVELELSQATRTCWDACRNSWVAHRMQQKCLPSYGNSPQARLKGPRSDATAANDKSSIRGSQGTTAALTASSPLGLWQSLVGTWEAPGSWPPNEEEQYVVERWQVGGWQREELEALAHKKGATA